MINRFFSGAVSALFSKIACTVVAGGFLFSSFNAAAQVPEGLRTVRDEEFGFTGRFGAQADWQVVRGLTLNAEYQIRTDNCFSAVERHQAGLGLSYKVCDYFRFGASYTFIGRYKSSSREFSPRHRASLFVTGVYDAGNLRMSLRETLELTHKSVSNLYQGTPNELTLRSRFKLSYRGFRHWEPYAYAELRNIFNAPSFTAAWNDEKQKWESYEFFGYRNAYITRVRAALGVEWKINRHHRIDFSALYHWTRGLEIDTNKEGTKLKDAFYGTGNDIALSVGYKFSF